MFAIATIFKISDSIILDINAVNNDCDTPLHCAVEKGKTEAVHHLLVNGAKTDILNNAKDSVLHKAVKCSKPEIIEAQTYLLSKIESKIKFQELAKFPELVDFNIRGSAGKTALHVASSIDSAVCAKALVRQFRWMRRE